MGDQPERRADLGRAPAWVPWLYAAGGLIAAFAIRSIHGSWVAVAAAAVGGVVLSGACLCVVAHLTGQDAGWGYGIYRWRARASRSAGHEPRSR